MDKVLNDANEATMRMRGGRWKKMDESSQLGTYLLCAKGREGKGGWRASCKDNAAGRLG